MSDERKAAKKPGKKKLIVIGLAVLLMVGGGVGAGLYASGAIAGGASHIDPKLPRLVLRDGVDDSVAAKYFSPTGDKAVDPTKFVASYYPLGEQFTVNLKDEDGFMQVGIGMSTYYDQRVLDNVKLHEMAVRSAVLTTLSQQGLANVSSAEGKEALKKDLRKAVNEALKSREGFGGIDQVYFTSFVVQ
ncbi:flagellar basal body-associated FliL family protein [Sphingosinicella humi]|uniref:Flagellar protein FliL n=1 Tax=Allosphingosinicella humi TaxID=2068657 RepID=A0A2U2J0Z6_9SPHN|nr:flagellar basal body-associated FliL family protein [Sphingosinicella humi]PWG02009.1 flagellar basal body protein FliL [Sphingosinicella humi]